MECLHLFLISSFLLCFRIYVAIIHTKMKTLLYDKLVITIDVNKQHLVPVYVLHLPMSQLVVNAHVSAVLCYSLYCYSRQ